jgi:hypothetical protein
MDECDQEMEEKCQILLTSRGAYFGRGNFKLMTFLGSLLQIEVSKTSIVLSDKIKVETILLQTFLHSSCFS